MLHPTTSFENIHLPPPNGSWNSLLDDFDTTLVDVRPLVRPPRSIEVGLAPLSESNLVVGFEGVEGLFLATWDELTLGDYVELVIHLPGGVRVEGGGRVEWLKDICGEGGPGVGVRFISLDAVDAELLERFATLREPIFHA